jgi:hypothetical protein
VRLEQHRTWTVRCWCCVRLAGASPAAVSAGAPRSRLRMSPEKAPSERSVGSPGGSSGCCGTSSVGVVGLSRCTSGVPPASRQNSGSTDSSGLYAIPAWRTRHEKTIGKPCAGNRHARFERGIQEPGLARAPRLISTNGPQHESCVSPREVEERVSVTGPATQALCSALRVLLRNRVAVTGVGGEGGPLVRND